MNVVLDYIPRGREICRAGHSHQSPPKTAASTTRASFWRVLLVGEDTTSTSLETCFEMFLYKNAFDFVLIEPNYTTLSVTEQIPQSRNRDHCKPTDFHFFGCRPDKQPSSPIGDKWDGLKKAWTVPGSTGCSKHPKVWTQEMLKLQVYKISFICGEITFVEYPAIRSPDNALRSLANVR